MSRHSQSYDSWRPDRAQRPAMRRRDSEPGHPQAHGSASPTESAVSERQRPLDPRLRVQDRQETVQSQRLLTPSTKAAVDQSVFASTLASALDADHGYQKQTDKVSALKQELDSRNEELISAQKLPHKAFITHLEQAVAKTQRLLRSAENDCLDIKKKRDNDLKRASAKLISLLTPDPLTGNAPDRKIDPNTQGKIEKTVREVSDRADGQQKVIGKLQEEVEHLRRSSDILALNHRLDALQAEVKVVQTQAANPNSLLDTPGFSKQLDALGGRVYDQLSTIFLRPSSLNIYVENFESYKIGVHDRLLKIESSIDPNTNVKLKAFNNNLVAVQNLHQVLHEKLNDLSSATTTTETSLQSLSKSVEPLLRDRVQLQEVNVLLNRVNEVTNIVSRLGEAVNRNNHSILSLNSRYNNLTSESLGKEITKTLNPFISTISVTMKDFQIALNALRLDMADLKTKQKSVETGFAEDHHHLTKLDTQGSQLEQAVEDIKGSLQRILQSFSEIPSKNDFMDLSRDVAKLQSLVPSMHTFIDQNQQDSGKSFNKMKADLDPDLVNDNGNGDFDHDDREGGNDSNVLWGTKETQEQPGARRKSIEKKALSRSHSSGTHTDDITNANESMRGESDTIEVRSSTASRARRNKITSGTASRTIDLTQDDDSFLPGADEEDINSAILLANFQGRPPSAHLRGNDTSSMPQSHLSDKQKRRAERKREKAKRKREQGLSPSPRQSKKHAAG